MGEFNLIPDSGSEIDRYPSLILEDVVFETIRRLSSGGKEPLNVELVRNDNIFFGVEFLYRLENNSTRTSSAGIPLELTETIAIVRRQSRIEHLISGQASLRLSRLLDMKYFEPGKIESLRFTYPHGGYQSEIVDNNLVKSLLGRQSPHDETFCFYDRTRAD